MDKNKIDTEKYGGYSGENSNVDLDFVIKFRNFDQVIYEIKQKDINANEKDLKVFFANLQKTIKMLEDTAKANSGFL